jgi:hypothetical protein
MHSRRGAGRLDAALAAGMHTLRDAHGGGTAELSAADAHPERAVESAILLGGAERVILRPQRHDGGEPQGCDAARAEQRFEGGPGPADPAVRQLTDRLKAEAEGAGADLGGQRERAGAWQTRSPQLARRSGHADLRREHDGNCGRQSREAMNECGAPVCRCHGCLSSKAR